MLPELPNQGWNPTDSKYPVFRGLGAYPMGINPPGALVWNWTSSQNVEFTASPSGGILAELVPGAGPGAYVAPNPHHRGINRRRC